MTHSHPPDQHVPSSAPPVPTAADVHERAIAGVLHGDDALLATTDHDPIAVERLTAWAADDAGANAVLSMPRPTAATGDHPGRLLLYAVARQYRFQSAPDLGADYLEALDASLERGAAAWAAAAATTWLGWIHHESEASTAWPIARLLLARHADAAKPATMLSALASLAERAGDDEEAGRLWHQARTHTDIVRSARTRWFVEYDWVRGRLLLSDGALSRAALVLERIESGLTPLGDAQARLVGNNAGLELVFCRCLLGRADEAVTGARRGAQRLEASESEYRVWWRGAEALAHALLGDADATVEAAAEQRDAGTDTTSLELSSILPALAVAAALRGDASSLDDAITRARVHERQRTIDPELRAIWRIFAGWACVRLGRTDDARRLVGELDAELAASAVRLPVYLRHADVLRAAVNQDEASLDAARSVLVEHGATVAAGALDPWGIVPSSRTHSVVHQRQQPRMRVDVLDGVRVLLDGAEVDAREWTRRRKVRVALAMLVAQGGRVDRDDLADELWAGEAMSPGTRQQRLSTVLAGVRRVVLATPSGGASARGRSLVLGSSTVELHLGEGDETDVDELRREARAVAAADLHEPAALLRSAATIAALTAGDPLQGVAAGPRLADLRDGLRQELAGACVALMASWLLASGVADDGGAAVARVPDVLLDVAAHAVRLQPHDEVAAAHQIRLLARAGRAVDASRAFHRLRAAISEDLGLSPSVELVRLHASVISETPTNDDLAAAVGH